MLKRRGSSFLALFLAATWPRDRQGVVPAAARHAQPAEAIVGRR